MSSDEDKKLVERIPGLIATVNKITAEAIAKIEAKDSLKGEKEILKQEAIRDITLKVAEKIEKMWQGIEIVNSNISKEIENSKAEGYTLKKLREEQKIIQRYANYFVKPLVDLMDVARKSNVDIYEMKYGRKIQTVGGVEKFDDFVRRKMDENKKKAKVIDITPEKIGENK